MDHLRDVLDRGETAHGCWLSLPNQHTTEVVARIGFDYACVDTQHGLADYTNAIAMLQVMELSDATPIVRVPWNEPGIIGRMLDGGAMGIIIPMVNSVAEAEAAVHACRYPPEGGRSHGPFRAAAQHGPDYSATANDRVLCIPMIETMHAVERLDEILAVPGVDAIYVGPADLSLSLGLEPRNNDDDARFTETIEHIAATAAAAGVVPGIHANAGLASRRQDQGFRLITVSTDAAALRSKLADELRVSREGGGTEDSSVY
ncbi:MAG: aldolase/citrate lyase family protein [Acidimicrobiales bacterium]|nr:aldolase/citrate lyase family protein [Acidimicrobiales bacterium]